MDIRINIRNLICVMVIMKQKFTSDTEKINKNVQNALKIRREFSSFNKFILAVILSQEPCQECLNVRVMIDKALFVSYPVP